MNNYVYAIGKKLYINLTNRCSNNCDFCIRHTQDGMEGTTLWVNEEPTSDDIIEQLPSNLDDYEDEIVFCGFGEPTYNLEALDEVASYLHCIDKTTRINTNGQGNLIHNEDITDLVVTSCDVINVSLNSSTAKKYQQHCKSQFGEKAFDAMLEFAQLCKQRGGNVVFSVVDSIGQQDIDACQKLADKMKIPLRVRKKI
ncbi:MAG: TatD family nuclease-associated radical SAM protein [Clostridia bacterium]|nr:TatD family nuclease-associated radical SAM protein [Clostridia bacterium]